MYLKIHMTPLLEEREYKPTILKTQASKHKQGLTRTQAQQRFQPVFLGRGRAVLRLGAEYVKFDDFAKNFFSKYLLLYTE
jgi:hypothetical protein